MQEFRDGSFGEILPASALLEQMAKASAPVLDELKALHFGTAQELQRLKSTKASPAPVLIPPVDAAYVSARLDEMERRLNEAMMQHHKEGVRVYSESALHLIAQGKQ
jgi:hypothetical protein